MQSALDIDAQNSLARVRNDEALAGDELALRGAKAVALLELIQEQTPTTSTLVSQCLYSRLGMGNREPEIREALDRLKDRGHLSYTEKLGYKLQSSAGQDWQRRRDVRPVTGDELSGLVAEHLTELVGNLELPRWRGRSFPWAAFYSDGGQRHEERLLGPRDPRVVSLDFHYLTNPERRARELWLQASSVPERRGRMMWVSGSPGDLPDTLRKLARSRYMVHRYETRVQSLSSQVDCSSQEYSAVSLQLPIGSVRDQLNLAAWVGDLVVRPCPAIGRQLHDLWPPVNEPVAQLQRLDVVPGWLKKESRHPGPPEHCIVDPLAPHSAVSGQDCPASLRGQC